MTHSIEITKEQFKATAGVFGVPVKAYESVLWDNAFTTCDYDEELATVGFTAGEFKIFFDEGADTYTVTLGDWDKQCSSKAGAKKAVAYLIELGQPTDVEDEEVELELYRLYKSIK